MNLDEFHKLNRKVDEENRGLVREEYDQVREMIRDYARRGHAQCAPRGHVFDEILAWCMCYGGERILNLHKENHEQAEFLKQLFDIGLAIGMELGQKQAVGLQILQAAAKPEDNHESKDAKAAD